MLQMSLSKQQNLQLINCFVGCHDLTCHCNNPAFHCLSILIKQLKPELKKQEKEQIQKWLGTTEEDVTHTEDFGEDLETLFAEDIGEDDG